MKKPEVINSKNIQIFSPSGINKITLRTFLGSDLLRVLEEILSGEEVLALEKSVQMPPEVIAWQLMDSDGLKQKIEETQSVLVDFVLQKWFKEYEKIVSRRIQKKKGPENNGYYNKKLLEVLKPISVFIKEIPNGSVTQMLLGTTFYNTLATRAIHMMDAFLANQGENQDYGIFSDESGVLSHILGDLNSDYYQKTEKDHPVFGVLYLTSGIKCQACMQKHRIPKADDFSRVSEVKFSEGFEEIVKEKRQILNQLTAEKVVADDIPFDYRDLSFVGETYITFPLADRGNTYRDLVDSLCFIEVNSECDLTGFSLQLNRASGHLNVAESHIPYYVYLEDVKDYEKLLVQVYDLLIKAFEESTQPTELAKYRNYSEDLLRKNRATIKAESVKKNVGVVIKEPELEIELPKYKPYKPEESEVVGEEQKEEESSIIVETTKNFDKVFERLGERDQAKVMKKIRRTLEQFGKEGAKGIKKMEIPGVTDVFRLRIGGRRVLFQQTEHNTFKVFNFDPRDNVYGQDLVSLVNS